MGYESVVSGVLGDSLPHCGPPPGVLHADDAGIYYQMCVMLEVRVCRCECWIHKPCTIIMT